MGFVARLPRLAEILISGESVSVSAEVAKLIIDECPYDGQRDLNEDRALLLAMAMERGTFLPNTQIAFGVLDGRFYLVNGQHRLNAVGLARLDQRFRIEVYPCQSRDDLDALYCRFDQPGGQRSLTQVSRSLGLHDDTDKGLRPATAALLLRAMPILMMDLRRVAPIHRTRATRDLDAKKTEAIKWKPWAIEYQHCLDRGLTTRTARFRTGGVFAIALVTLRYQHATAREFWSEATRCSGLLSDDPRQALHSHFLSSKRSRSEYDLMEAAANAWNAFFQKRRLTQCKALGSPIKLLGTPFLGDA